MNNIKIIGNTPMIKINYEFKNNKKYIYAKLEYYNLTGSIKDRVALYMIKNAKKRGILKDDMPIIEATSGNTGISLSAIRKAYGHKVYIFMPDWVSIERRKLIKAYGAEVILYSKEEGGFLRCIEEAKKLAIAKDGYLTNQFSNKDNFLAHYETTGKEFIEQLPEELGGFISGVGISSGANFLGAILLNEKTNKPVATIFADDNKKYLSTDLFKNNAISRRSQNLISNNIKLNSYELI